MSLKLATENVNVNVLSDLSIDAMDVSGEQQVWIYIFMDMYGYICLFAVQ